MKHETIGFIGAGNMARSLVGGLLNNGWEKDRLLLADPDAKQRATIEETLGVAAYPDNNEVAQRASILVFAVKPQIFKSVATPLAPVLAHKKPLVISIAAGIRIEAIERWLGTDLAIVRAMPNTPALVLAGSTGLFANARTDHQQRDKAEAILRAVGVAVWIKNEELLDTVTALSGSGPAYFFLIMEALEQAAIRLGLDRTTARLLTIETAYGAAKMAEEGGEDPGQLRARVTSPGGTTESALRVLKDGCIDDLFYQALCAAATRSRELADLFGKE